MLWATKNVDFFLRQHQKKHNYFSKVKQLTPPSKFSTIPNWKLKLMKGKWYRISKLLSFPPAVGHQRCINLHVLLLYGKLISLWVMWKGWDVTAVFQQSLSAFCWFSWHCRSFFCPLLIFVVLLRQFSWKDKVLVAFSVTYVTMMSLQQRYHVHTFRVGLTELIF